MLYNFMRYLYDNNENSFALCSMTISFSIFLMDGKIFNQKSIIVPVLSVKDVSVGQKNLCFQLTDYLYNSSFI